MVAPVASVGRLLLALFLVGLNGFFVASEFALVRIRATSVEGLVDEGRAGSTALQEAVANLDDYLAATQLGITVASLGLGWAGEPAIASLIEPLLEPVLSTELVRLVAFAVGFGSITFLHVVFGELAPKTVAIARAERLALLVAPPMRFFYYLFLPGLVVFNGAANAVTGLLGVPPASETEETLEEREIRRVLSRSGEAGHVDTAEVEMIERVFDLDDTPVRAVMVPRPDVVTLPADATVSEIRSTVRAAGHTRYPVIGTDDPDHPVGVVDVKDVLRAIDADTAVTAADLARGVIVVPETTTVSDLLVSFREERQQMAAVIDEWGALAGIATAEDVVEAVVGDLRDAFDVRAREPSIHPRSDGSHEIDGGVGLSAVNDALGTAFAGEGFETIGGLVLDRLGRVPDPGDRVEIDGHVLEVTDVTGTRVSTVLVHEAGTGGETVE